MSLGNNESDKIRLKRLSHAAIGVRDLVRQAEFYANILGLEVVEQSSQHLYFRAAGSHHHTALNLWNTRDRMGPPRGFGWLLPALAMTSRLSRYICPN
jgi:catechol-2,3-dioxygenase